MNSIEILPKILHIVKDFQELEEVIGNLSKHVRGTLQDCLDYCTSRKTSDSNSIKFKLYEIDSVIDFLNDELNTGHWSEVSIKVKQNFTVANFVKCCLLMKSKIISNDHLKKSLHCTDMGLLLGAPLSTNSALLSQVANILTTQMNLSQPEIFPPLNNRSLKRTTKNDSYEAIRAKEIDTVECPSVEHFNRSYFQPQIPVKLTECMKHWPALTKWVDLNYLLRIAGERTVPVEVGSQYTDENWSQKLMPVQEFISKYYLSDNGDIGYLAQHNLFDQITALKDDIHIPDYCCLSLDYDNSMEPDINAWLGPKGTVSPLHTDPKNNILAQVYGTKQILLFPPGDSKYLYCHEDKLLHNTAQVDPLRPDKDKFPDFIKSTMYKCLLEPGEMLYIPTEWWHHVVALDKSFSVSFWWQ